MNIQSLRDAVAKELDVARASIDRTRECGRSVQGSLLDPTVRKRLFDVLGEVLKNRPKLCGDMIVLFEGRDTAGFYFVTEESAA